MKNKILYVNGCSFAYGMGISVHEHEAINNRFSASLSQKLGYEDLNKSIPGSCNARIGRRTALDFYQYRPDIAVIVWSDPARFEFADPKRISPYKYHEDAEQVRPLSVHNYPRERRHAFLGYYEYISSSGRDVYYTLQEMLTVKVIADSLGIKCIQIPFKETFHRELLKVSGSGHKDYTDTLNEYVEILSKDKMIFGINDSISFDSISGCDVNPTMLSALPDQGGHPNKECHDIMASWLHHFIKENIL